MKNLVSFEKWHFQGGVQADTTFESGGVILVQFSWSDNFPLKNATPESSERASERKNELWKTTCFEAFLKPKFNKTYFEVNISPRNFWNAYSFDEYRKPQPPKEAAAWKLLEIKSKPHELSARIQTNLKKDIYQIGLTCVLESTDGQKSHWALKHCKGQPDFHVAESFLLERDFK